MAGKKTLKQKVYEFLHEFRAATLSTFDGKTPHGATVYAAADRDLNLYFTTRTEGRKYNNLVKNPTVAMVITDDRRMITVQATGRAISMEGEQVEADILDRLWRFRFDDPNWPVPPIKLLENDFSRELSVIKVVPSEMSCANFEGTPSGHYRSYFEKII